MDEDEALLGAIGLALAALASLIERPDPVPRGEVGRCLALLAETGAPDQARQNDILKRWSQILSTATHPRHQ